MKAIILAMLLAALGGCSTTPQDSAVDVLQGAAIIRDIGLLVAP